MIGKTTDVDPYNGTYMARLNDIQGGYHATQITQSDTVTQQDIDDNAVLYVNWGAMLIEPSNSDDHSPNNHPNFGVNVTIDGKVTAHSANALAHNTDPSWSYADYRAGELYYKTNTWSFDLLSLGDAAGSTISINLWVVDCGLSAHGGYAFLDGIGTIYQPPTTENPEPATLFLFATGLLGLAGAKRLRKKNKSQ